MKSVFFNSELRKQRFLQRKVLGNKVCNKQIMNKKSCPRIYFLICTSVLSLPFIRLFISFCKKYFQLLLHFALTSWVCCLQISALQIVFNCSLVSYIFLYTYLYQPDPQQSITLPSFGRSTGYNTKIYFRKDYVYAALNQFGFRLG